MVNSDVAFRVLLFVRNFLRFYEVRNQINFNNFLFYLLFHLSNSCDPWIVDIQLTI